MHKNEYDMTNSRLKIEQKEVLSMLALTGDAQSSLLKNFVIEHALFRMIR